MATNKHAIIRYQTLDKCFRNSGRRYSINDLLEACNEAILNYDPSLEGIKRRQLYDDINFMQSEQGWLVSLDKNKEGRNVYYRYEDPNFTINSQSLNALEATEIKSALQVLSRFQGMPQFSWVDELIPKINQEFGFSGGDKIMAFEGNEFLEGINFLAPLFNAIQNKQPLRITYRSFISDKDQIFNVSPYLLKQYNNRWFLFCKSPNYSTLTNLAIDRIIEVEESKIEFENCNIDFDEYFDDFIGVSKNDQEDLQKIYFRGTKEIAPYIKSKPFHSSQKRVSENDDFFEFMIEVIPNYELKTHVLSFGDQIEVVKPDSFRDEIKKVIENTGAKYRSI